MRFSAAAVLVAALASAPALAQTLPPGATPGMTNQNAVNPAPGARGPYLGHPGAFYDPMARLDALSARLSTVPPRQAAPARRDLHRIRVFATTQRDRHGGRLRDWDRERMTRMMNDLVRRYPALRRN